MKIALAELVIALSLLAWAVIVMGIVYYIGVMQ